MITNLLSGIAAKLGGAGLAAKAGVGLTMAAASVTGAGAAGVLPDPVQNVVGNAVTTVTPFEFPDNADDNAEFGKRVSADATDDQPGVDGSVIADEARKLAEQRRLDAGVADDAASNGLDRARQTPAAPHVPTTVPGGPSAADQYRPGTTPGPPQGIPSGQPEGREPEDDGEEVPGGQPEGSPTQPEETPSGQPGEIPGEEPEEIPGDRPEKTPTGAPEGLPTGGPSR